MTNTFDGPTSEFVRLTTKHQRSIYWYIMTLLPNRHDADEVLQETNIVLWRKFAEFEPGTNFLAWACRIARFEALRYGDKHRRRVPNFSDILGEDYLEQLAADVAPADGVSAALDACLQRLPPADFELIQLRYAPGATVADVAARVGRSTDALYKAFARIHNLLHECVQRRLRTEER